MMTKRRVLPVKKYETASFPVHDIHSESRAACMPTNLSEEKEKFFKSGKTPEFRLKDRAKVEELASKAKNTIRFDLLGEAQFILEKVREKYGDGEYFLEHAFGDRITKEEATPVLLNYISENNLPESIKINWCDNMTCSAKMVWAGPHTASNRPELRKYSLWVSGSDENPYMRESGIKCLMDHEIGTHFFRSFNDGFQPWYSERERFGLRKLGSVEALCTEEGLAAIHTVLRGRISMLWIAAMGYYIACKSAEMTFRELFDHLGRYTSNRDYRWKQAMRVKRGLSDPNDLGGLGNDQCYFEGAVNILRRLDTIDFQLLMMGKLCYDELDRVKRVVRRDVVQYPNFMKNIKAYRKSLRKILILNGLDGEHLKHGPPKLYLKQIEEKKAGKFPKKKKQVRSRTSLAQNSTGNIKDKNKNKNFSKTQEDLINRMGEIRSFACSNNFRRLSKPPKAVTDMENILTAEPKALKDVKELTTALYEKDSALKDQIERLNSIVKNHQYLDNQASCSGEKSSPEKELNKRSQLPHISDNNALTSSNPVERESYSLGTPSSVRRPSSNGAIPNIYTYDLCSGTPCSQSLITNNESEFGSLCFEQNKEKDRPHTAFKRCEVKSIFDSIHSKPSFDTQGSCSEVQLSNRNSETLQNISFATKNTKRLVPRHNDEFGSDKEDEFRSDKGDELRSDIRDELTSYDIEITPNIIDELRYDSRDESTSDHDDDDRNDDYFRHDLKDEMYNKHSYKASGEYQFCERIYSKLIKSIASKESIRAETEGAEILSMSSVSSGNSCKTRAKKSKAENDVNINKNKNNNGDENVNRLTKLSEYHSKRKRLFNKIHQRAMTSTLSRPTSAGAMKTLNMNWFNFSHSLKADRTSVKPLLEPSMSSLLDISHIPVNNNSVVRQDILQSYK